MKLAFSKYHGAGNDFIMVDNRTDDRRIHDVLSAETIANLCRRAHGIGADGLIQVIKHDGEIPYTMGYFNSDGTLAEMCGNGLRCTLQFLADLGEPVRTMPEVGIMTGAGPIKVRFADDERIQVSMPIPSFSPRDAKVVAENEVIHGEGDEVHAIGSRLMVHRDLFPEGVNVGFARKESPDTLALVVYERGCGPTLACGSGAIAAVAAGIREGRFDLDQTVNVRMPGGDLKVTIGEDWSFAVLEGTAVKVFEGNVEL